MRVCCTSASLRHEGFDGWKSHTFPGTVRSNPEALPFRSACEPGPSPDRPDLPRVRPVPVRGRGDPAGDARWVRRPWEKRGVGKGPWHRACRGWGCGGRPCGWITAPVTRVLPFRRGGGHIDGTNRERRHGRTGGTETGSSGGAPATYRTKGRERRGWNANTMLDCLPTGVGGDDGSSPTRDVRSTMGETCSYSGWVGIGAQPLGNGADGYSAPSFPSSWFCVNGRFSI